MEAVTLGEYRLGQGRSGQRSFGKYLPIRSSFLIFLIFVIELAKSEWSRNKVGPKVTIYFRILSYLWVLRPILRFRRILKSVSFLKLNIFSQTHINPRMIDCFLKPSNVNERYLENERSCKQVISARNSTGTSRPVSGRWTRDARSLQKISNNLVTMAVCFIWKRNELALSNIFFSWKYFLGVEDPIQPELLR